MPDPEKPNTAMLVVMAEALDNCDQICWNCKANAAIAGFESVMNTCDDPCNTVCDVLTLIVDQF